MHTSALVKKVVHASIKRFSARISVPVRKTVLEDLQDAPATQSAYRVILPSVYAFIWIENVARNVFHAVHSHEVTLAISLTISSLLRDAKTWCCNEMFQRSC